MDSAKYLELCQAAYALVRHSEFVTETIGRMVLSDERSELAAKGIQCHRELIRLRGDVISQGRQLAAALPDADADTMRQFCFTIESAGGFNAARPLWMQVDSILRRHPPTLELTATQQSYVVAGAIWLAFKERAISEYQAGNRSTEPTRSEAYPIAKQLGWVGDESQFKQHANEGTKPKWLGQAEAKAKESEFLSSFLAVS